MYLGTHYSFTGSLGAIIITMSTKNTLIDKLFAAGAHYGFSKSRRHPSVVPYVFGTKQGNDIFDLTQTAVKVAEAAAALEAAGKDGKTVLFVGTKTEAAKLTQTMAESASAPYVVNRWIGGILTNFSEIKKRIERLKSLLAEKESGELDRKYTKKERVVIGREIDKLTFNFGGIVDMEKIPGLMVVVDPRHDDIAVIEAREIGIPVIGILSSDNDLTKVTHPVPVNDALTSSLEVVLNELVTAYKAGVAAHVPPTRTDNRTSRRPRVTDRATS
jgi:small subunit ribosomal protein S2